MARKRKGELPSGNVRRKVYIGSELVFDEKGLPVIDEKTGKQKKKPIYKSITAKNAQEVEALKAEYKSGQKRLATPSNMTLYEAMDKYIESNNALLSPSTIRGYRTIQKTAFRTLIGHSISTITNDMLREAVNAECKIQHSKTGSKALSPKTIRNRYGFVETVLRYYRPDLDTRVKLPQMVTEKHDISKPELIFEAVKGTEIELPVLLAMWLSFTVSEIKGLSKSKSLSADGWFITIDEVMVKDEHNNEVTKKQGKQPKRNRTLRIPEYIKSLIDQVETDRLVTLSGQALSKRFIRTIERSGLPHMTFHDLRHVNASVMTILNVPDIYAQDRGGWHTDHIMKSHYQQAYSDERIKVDNKIDDYFSGIVESSPEEKRWKEKYNYWLLLFDRKPSKKSEKDFEKFCSDNGIIF